MQKLLWFFFTLSTLSACSVENSVGNGAQTPADPLSVPQGDTLRISPDGTSYADPEILNYGENKITFQDLRGRIWVTDLDPASGDFVSGTVNDILLDTDAESLLVSYNGPEFGLDSQGWSVFYTRNLGGDIQIWRAEVNASGNATQERITSGGSHMTAITQKSSSLASTRILYINGDWINAGMLAWLDENSPSVETDFAPVDTRDTSHPTWVEDSNKIIMSVRDGADTGQLALYDIVSGPTVITGDAGDKTFPFTWQAPEYDNETLALALVDKTSIAIYRDNGGAYWDRISTLTIPAVSGGITVGSAEPFVAMNKSYISLSVQLNSSSLPGTADAQIWIFGIDDNPATRFVYRCDDGSPSPVMRIDPETLTGSEQVFVYYNVYTQIPSFELYRCATGIRTK